MLREVSVEEVKKLIPSGSSRLFALIDRGFEEVVVWG